MTTLTETKTTNATAPTKPVVVKAFTPSAEGLVMIVSGIILIIVLHFTMKFFGVEMIDPRTFNLNQTTIFLTVAGIPALIFGFDGLMTFLSRRKD